MTCDVKIIFHSAAGTKAIQREQPPDRPQVYATHLFFAVLK